MYQLQIFNHIRINNMSGIKICINIGKLIIVIIVIILN